MRVVAEGIETEAQLAYLRELECEFGQGFLISRPLKAPDLAIWVQQQVLATAASMKKPR